jgi:hypothetical protein
MPAVQSASVTPPQGFKQREREADFTEGPQTYIHTFIEVVYSHFRS